MSFKVSPGNAKLRRRCCLLFFGIVLLGCSDKEAQEEIRRRSSNLQSLAGMYRMYTSEHGGRPPANEADFKNFIMEQGLEHFEEFGITSVDDLFISPRDGQPYVVAYGGRPESIPDIVAYEQVGTESGRWAASSMAIVVEIDEANFTGMVPSESHP